MACASYTLNAIDARCDTSYGGIKEILIANVDDVKSISLGTSGLIEGITLEEGKHFVKWQFRPNTGSYTSTNEKDVTVGTSFATTEVALQFSRAEATKRADIQSAINARAIIIIKDMYGEYLLIGNNGGAEVSNAVMQSGTANTDLSGFTLTFSETSEELPHFIDKSKVDIEDLLA